jgi:hypothetical protein
MYTSQELTNIRNSGVRLWSSWAKLGYTEMTTTLNPDDYERQVVFYLVNKALKYAMDGDQTNESVLLANLLVGMDSLADGNKLALSIV